MKCRCKQTTRFLLFFFTCCIVFLMVLGVFWGTLGSLKMIISSRRNTDFHVFNPRECDLEIGTRKKRKKLSAWKDLGVHFCDFSLLKRVLKASKKKTRKKVRKKLKQLFFGAGPAECAVAGERLDRGQKSKKVRILEKVIGKSFSSHHSSTLGFEFSTLVPSLRSGRRIASRIPPGHFISTLVLTCFGKL